MRRPLNLKWIWFALIVVLLILTRFILFKKSPTYYKNYFTNSYHVKTLKDGWRQANFKPFATIQLFSKSKRLRTQYIIDNIAGNLLGFAPVGLLLACILINSFLFIRVVFLTLSISFFFELIQLLSGLGSFDVDDLILNTLGGVIGFFLFRVFLPDWNQDSLFSHKLAA